MKKESCILALMSIIMMILSSVCLAYNLDFNVNQPSGEITSTVGNVLGVVQWIGFVVAIAMLIYVGIKYLTAGAGKKAEAKDTLIPMLIGAALVALAPTIANAVFTTIGSGTTSSTGGTSSSTTSNTNANSRFTPIAHD